MDGIKGIFVGFLLIGLFLFGMISLGITLSSENNATQSIADNQIINASFGDIKAELDTSKSASDDSKTSFFEESDKELEGELTSGATRGGSKGYLNRATAIFRVIFGKEGQGGLIGTIGISSLVLTVIGTILTVVGLLYLWRLIKAGQ